VNCEAFKDWLAESRARTLEQSPAASAHVESCGSCRQTADEEQVWRHLFGLIPEHSRGPSLWSGVTLAIQERQHRKLSLSDALLLFSRRLAPAFVVLLMITGGWFLWSSPRIEAEGGSMIAMLETSSSGFMEEPDAILVAWAEAGRQ